MSETITVPVANAFTKEVIISTRFTVLESMEIVRRARAASVSKCDFVRQASLNGKVLPPPVIPEINKDHWLALARLGANLNQLAAHLNSGGIVDDSVGRLLAEIRQLLADVRALLIGAEGGPHGLPY